MADFIDYEMPENTKYAWSVLDKHIINRINNQGKITGFIVRVSVGGDASKPDSDVLNLQYFFPIADRIRAVYGILPQLHVTDNTDNHQAKQYLFSQAQGNEVGIKVNGFTVNLYDQQRFGRLLPLFKINGIPSDTQSYYTCLMEDTLISSQMILNLSGIYKSYQKLLDDYDVYSRKITFDNKQDPASILHMIDNFRAQVETFTHPSDIFRKNVNEAASSVKKGRKDVKSLLSISRLFFIDENEVTIDHLVKICMGNLVYLMEEMKGVRENAFSNPEKQELVDKLLDYLSNKMMGLPMLAKLIWSVILRFLLDQKKLAVKNGEELSLQEDILEKSRSDALAYSEGIFQLIENACLHTERKAAYFNIRTYSVDRNAPFGRMAHDIDTLVRLDEKYNGGMTGLYEFKKDIDFYLEMMVLDDSFSCENQRNYGITEKFNESKEKKLNDLTQVFHYDHQSLQSIEDTINHYGLKLFRKIVVVNGGCFVCISPHTTGKCEKYATSIMTAKQQPKYQLVDSFAGSEYNVLLPIKYYWEHEGDASVYTNQELFDSNILKNILEDEKNDYTWLVYKPKQPVPYKNVNDKLKVIRDLYADLSDWFGEYLQDRVMFINASDFAYSHIEILAKALFYYIYDLKDSKNVKHLVPIALFFKEKSHISEFIRIMSIFYNKQGKSDLMNNIQIALSSAAGGTPEVNFLLAGENITSAKKSAQLFAYYNSEASMEFISHIEYLTRTDAFEPETINTPAHFPFDLYLECSTPHETYSTENPVQMTLNDLGTSSNNSTWFLQRINNILQKDIRQNPYGCKLENIHVSLTSNIHIDTFYEAELLFHNIGNVYRFAFLCAKEIIKDIKSESKHKTVIVVGYENYSSTLIYEITRIIEKVFGNLEVLNAIYLYDDEGNEKLSFSKDFWKGTKHDLKETIFYAVLPIGSTMSTIYKIHNKVKHDAASKMKGRAESGYGSVPVFGKNICIIAVGNTSGIISEKEQQIRNRYWQSISPPKKSPKITLTQFTMNESPVSVHYMLSAPSTWYDANDCALCDKNKILIEVDGTSTIPNMIFELFNSNRECITNLISNPTENERRLELLKNCITYAHTYRGNNHFQYHIDFLAYFRKANQRTAAKSKLAVSDWLKTTKSKIDGNAFNIIVSPLHETNSFFLKAVIDHAFDHCISFMHIPINHSFKEDIRGKFKYISEEFKRMRVYDPHAKLNIYFADDSIVSGHTINRGRNLMRMLLDESKTPYADVELFKGVFLLVNRCSFDTINTFVKNPDTDFFAYLHVAVPSYNTQSNVCPACKIALKYELIQKRSASGKLSNEYKRLADKHKMKSINAHEKWLNENILTQHSYLALLKRWLYRNVPDNPQYNIKGIIDIQNDDVPIIFKIRDFIRDAVANNNPHDPLVVKKTTLNGFLDSIDEKERQEYKVYIIDIMNRYVIAEQNYMRLKCTHDAYCRLESIAQNHKPDMDIVYETRTAILDLISECFKKICSNITPHKLEQKERSYLVEWLISYIKVISREQLSKYHHIRQAISDIMMELAHAMLHGFDNPSYNAFSEDLKMILGVINADMKPEDIRFTNCLAASMQYQVFRTFLRRLSSLQAMFVIKKENREKVAKLWYALSDKYRGIGDYSDFYKKGEKGDWKESYILYNEIPIIEDMVFDYEKLIKWASMSGIDDSKDYIINKEAPMLMEKAGESEYEKTINNISKYMFLENTRVVFDGIKRLALLKQDKMLSPYISYDSDELYQNPMSSFFRFMGVRKYDEALKYIVEYFICTTQLYSLSTYHIEESEHDDFSYEAPTPNSKVIDDPYGYEQLCNYMCAITGYTDCFLVQSTYKSVKLLVSSDEKIEEAPDAMTNPFDISDESFSDILSKYMPDDVLSYCVIDERKYGMLIIKLDIYSHNKHMSSEDGVYIILRKLGTPDYENSLRHVRNILFLRERLSYIIQRDLHALLRFRNTYEYVEPLNPSTNVFLHISDLHIRKDDEKKIVRCLDNISIPKDKIDLLLITGDVVQADKSSFNIEQNYKTAARIIKRIAQKIWNEDGRLRQDWRKRVVIIPGNHDYATMTDIETVEKRRETASGTPSDAEGTTMAQFAYFIDFIQDLLNIDIGKYIHNNLNEIRHYEKLDTDLICLHSSTGVGPLRSNKVKLSNESIKRMMINYTHTPSRQVICLVHHTPDFPIDYVEDMYHSRLFVQSREYKNLIHEFKEFVTNNNDSHDNLKSFDELFKSAISQIRLSSCREPDLVIRRYYKTYLKSCGIEVKSEIDYDTFSKSCSADTKDILIAIYCEDLEREFKSSLLHKDISHYLKTVKARDMSSERSMQIASKIGNAKNMSDIDRGEYKESFQTIAGHINLILGGHRHIHVKSEYEGKPVYEAGRFYDDQLGQMAYGILCKVREGTERRGISVEYDYKYYKNGEEQKPVAPL